MPRATMSRRSQAVAVTLGLLALLASLIGLAACDSNGGATSTGAVTPTVAHPTPTLDAQTQAYIDVLNTYYRPLGADLTTEGFWFNLHFNDTVSGMTSERPVEAGIASEAQTLVDHLTVTPPAQLQADDGYLKQAAKLTAANFTKLVALIDAQDLQQFVSFRGHDVVANNVQYCGPITHINSLLPQTAHLPLNSGPCGEGIPTPTP